MEQYDRKFHLVNPDENIGDYLHVLPNCTERFPAGFAAVESAHPKAKVCHRCLDVINFSNIFNFSGSLLMNK